MKVGVLGAGYVGLVTAACLGRIGNIVTVVEADPARLEQLRRGELPISEPGLDELVAEMVATGRLTFSSDPADLRDARLTIVCVGTLDADGEWSADTVRRAVRALAEDRSGPRQIVVRSTLLPGTAVQLDADARDADPAASLAFNPEFTREGNAVADFLAPDRVVIGVRNPALASAIADDLRALFEPLEAPIVVTDLTSAEAIKVASNVFLSAKITFANELARLCAALGADVQAVVDGMGLDTRIGRRFLSPGPGFGGSCFPSQSRALPELADRHGVSVPLMRAIASSNESQAEWLLDRLELDLERPLRDLQIALLGLSFKADTDDLRESPALRLAHGASERGARVRWYDPLVTLRGERALAADGTVAHRAESAEDALRDADAAIIATEWPEFAELDWARLAPMMHRRVVLDARSVVDLRAAHAARVRVLSLGVLATSPEIESSPVEATETTRSDGEPVPAGADAR